MRPVKGIPIKMNRNKFDVNDVQLLNKFKLKGRISNMYICKHVLAWLLRNIYLDAVYFELFLESGCILFFPWTPLLEAH